MLKEFRGLAVQWKAGSRLMSNERDKKDWRMARRQWQVEEERPSTRQHRTTADKILPRTTPALSLPGFLTHS